MLPCCCGTNQDSALGLWPVHSSTSLWLRAGVLDTLFSPFLVIFPSLNLWHDYLVFQSQYVANKDQQKVQIVHAEVVRQNVNFVVSSHIPLQNNCVTIQCRWTLLKYVKWLLFYFLVLCVLFCVFFCPNSLLFSNCANCEFFCAFRRQTPKLGMAKVTQVDFPPREIVSYTKETQTPVVTQQKEGDSLIIVFKFVLHKKRHI